MKAVYAYSRAGGMADTFVLYRIVGNDLTPRHAAGQSLENVRFILEHEPELPDCEKRWILNRITDPGQEERIIELLERHGQPYLRIPFEAGEYRRRFADASGGPPLELGGERAQAIASRYEMHLRRFKTLYAMNNNGARNAALRDGRSRAKWVMPFDGNCFFTVKAFEAVRVAVLARPHCPYVVVPMARLADNDALLDPDFAPMASEEPQVVFRCDAQQMFDERVPYGRRPKVELLWRLGVPGVWDSYGFDAWDFARLPRSGEAGDYQVAGWVARLSSGRVDLEGGAGSTRSRDSERATSIIARIDMLDELVAVDLIDATRLAYYDEAAVRDLVTADPALAAVLRADAEQWLERGPWSVMQKTTLPPSEDRHDYWHAAPYWWPDPSKPDGLPYIQRDGQRVPGTVLSGEGSERYDRTSFQHMADATVTLSLAAAAWGDARFGAHAARLVRAWFIDPATGMNPHLDYSQVRMGHNGNKNVGSGIIELRDVAFVLDGVRLLIRDGHVPEADVVALKAWLTEYADWLQNSAAGKHEMASTNNHGTFYDVQLLAIGLFIGSARIVAGVRHRWPLRLFTQLRPDGTQPLELKRENPRHYCAFNLTGWDILARQLSTVECDVWSWRDAEGRSLRGAIIELAHQESTGWARDEPFDAARLMPLWRDFAHRYPGDGLRQPVVSDAPPGRFDPDTGLAPYWMLARRA